MQLQPSVIEGLRLGVVGGNMVQEMHLPELNSVLVEAIIMERKHLLQLVLQQQPTLNTHTFQSRYL